MDENSAAPAVKRRTSRASRTRVAGVSVLDVARLGPLDESLPVPLYIQLADKLSGFIRKSRKHATDICLPSENQCMAFFKVSRPTVRQAMSELSVQGLIRRERGRGTFINNSRIEHDLRNVFEDDMRAKGKTVTFTVLDSVQVDTPIWLRGPFKGQKMYRVRRVRLLSGSPISVEDRYIPAKWTQTLDTALLENGSVFHVLQRCAQVKTIQCVNTVFSELADPDIARLLETDTGAPVLVRDTWYYESASKPLMYSRVIFLGQSYQFRFESQVQVSS